MKKQNLRSINNFVGLVITKSSSKHIRFTIKVSNFTSNMALTRKSIFLFSILLLLNWGVFAKVTHLIVIKPEYDQLAFGKNELNHFKITLFDESRRDSLLIPRYSNCLNVKGKLAQYNGEFILYDKQIPYTKIKIEHPRYVTTFTHLNKTVALIDSIDIFNQRHHILIHETRIKVEQECNEEKKFDYLFKSGNQSHGGFYNENHIGVLMHDSLTIDSLKSVAKKYKLTYKNKSYDGKNILFKLQKGKLKKGRNKVIGKLLMDSLLVKDAGVTTDTNLISYLSSFYRINALHIDQIDKWNFEPISGLMSMAKALIYIKNNELELGCGLYRIKNGLGYKILDLQNQIEVKTHKKKCKESALLIALDKEYITIKTRTFSIHGGKDIKKKKLKNEKKMGEIRKEEKEVKKSFYTPFSFIEPILLKK